MLKKASVHVMRDRNTTAKGTVAHIHCLFGNQPTLRMFLSNISVFGCAVLTGRSRPGGRVLWLLKVDSA